MIDLAGAAEHEDLCEAAMFYLLERLRIALEDPVDIARVKLMVVDEAWRYLKDPAVLSYLAEAAKTWRKKNAALIMATQSAVDVTGTPGAAGLLESMPTKVFLANPNLPEKVGEIFRLNPDEMETIRSLVPKMELYLRRADLAAILRLEVDPASYWLYTSNPRDSRPSARPATMEEHGICNAPSKNSEHGNKWTAMTHQDFYTENALQCIASRQSCGSSGLASWCRSSCHGPSLRCRAAAQDGGPMLRIAAIPGVDQLVDIETRVRHTTVIVLPETENILDFVVGDSEYWHLTGAANVAFLKPIATGVETNVALICESGRIYSFLASEGGEPHLVVRIEPPTEDDSLISAEPHTPAFIARSEVTAYQAMAQQARETARNAQTAADIGGRRSPGRGSGRRGRISGGLSHAPAFCLHPVGSSAGSPLQCRSHVARPPVHLSPLPRPGIAGPV